MNVLDQIVSKAHQENPALGILLSTYADGGRIVATSVKIWSLFQKVSAEISCELRAATDLDQFVDLTVRDLVLLENPSVDDLWTLNRKTGAQIAVMSEREQDSSLVDVCFREEVLRSALISLLEPADKIKAFKGQYFLQGSRLNKAIFFDRDGVVIQDEGYVSDPGKVRLLPGISALMKKAREQGYFLFVVTNQSGLGRGIMSWSQYEKVTHRMQDLLVQEGAYFDRIVKAPFYQDSKFASSLVRRTLRKPRVGMFHQIVDEFRIDISQSKMIGDSATDLMTGALIGVKDLYLLKGPKTAAELEKWNQWPLRSRSQSHFAGKAISSLSEVL